MAGINEKVTGNDSVAIVGTASEGERTYGIKGTGDAVGIYGEGKTWHGVAGISHSTLGGVGVFGMNFNGSGVVGESNAKFNAGVFGIHKGDANNSGWGVRGQADNGTGISGESKTWVGVYGETADIENGAAGVWGEHKGAGIGVKAVSKDGAGLAAYSTGNEAIHAETQSPGTAAIAAYNLNPAGTGAAIFAKKEGTQGHAGFFDGDVWVSRKLSVGIDIVLANADCAEDFNIGNEVTVEPGTVMVIGEGDALFPCQDAYDKRAAGVVSGAGDYKPGIVLDKQQSAKNRQPIALLGKVYCKADAQYGAIEVGDMLTTSPNSGHAMKADDPQKAFGAVIGKALKPLRDGAGLIPILICLQ